MKRTLLLLWMAGIFFTSCKKTGPEVIYVPPCSPNNDGQKPPNQIPQSSLYFCLDSTLDSMRIKANDSTQSLSEYLVWVPAGAQYALTSAMIELTNITAHDIFISFVNSKQWLTYTFQPTTAYKFTYNLEGNWTHIAVLGKPTAVTTGAKVNLRFTYRYQGYDFATNTVTGQPIK
jgi:hypothetical protein